MLTRLPCTGNIIKNRMYGLENTLAVKSPEESSRAPSFHSQYIQKLTTICHYSLSRSDTISWPPWSPAMKGVQRHAYRKKTYVQNSD